MIRSLMCVLTILIVAASASVSADVPEVMSYQAVLLDSNGDPVISTVEVRFTIYDAATAGTALWAETLQVSPDATGSFDKLLGEVNPLNDAVMSAADRWMSIAINGGAELEPRTKLAASPYAFRVQTVDAATAGVVKGNLTVAPSDTGTGDDALLVIKGPGGDEVSISTNAVNINEDVTREAKTIAELSKAGLLVFGETPADTLSYINALTGQMTVTDRVFVQWAATKSPFDRGDGAVEDGTNSSSFGPNNVSTADNSMAVGANNVASNVTSVFIVGNDNLIEDDLGDPTVWADGSVAIGDSNTVKGNSSFVVGKQNYLGANQSTVFGRKNSTTGSGQVFVFGDSCSTSNTGNASITGGQYNGLQSASLSVISGGSDNLIDNAQRSSIGGGHQNTIDGGGDAAIGGGSFNVITGSLATIGGGHYNEANGDRSTVAGGASNHADAPHATVGGGQNNYARGDYATVPGGYNNRADSAYSFAAGNSAQTTHRGVFIWADDQGGNGFNSTDTNQFLIRASNGVGINTNAPTQPLTVAGQIYSTTGGFRFPDGSVQSSAASTATDGWTDGGNYVYTASNNDSVGIGTATPTAKLDVAGKIQTNTALSIVSGSPKTGASIVEITPDSLVMYKPADEDSSRWRMLQDYFEWRFKMQFKAKHHPSSEIRELLSMGVDTAASHIGVNYFDVGSDPRSSFLWANELSSGVALTSRRASGWIQGSPNDSNEVILQVTGDSTTFHMGDSAGISVFDVFMPIDSINHDPMMRFGGPSGTNAFQFKTGSDGPQMSMVGHWNDTTFFLDGTGMVMRPMCPPYCDPIGMSIFSTDGASVEILPDEFLYRNASGDTTMALRDDGAVYFDVLGGNSLHTDPHGIFLIHNTDTTLGITDLPGYAGQIILRGGPVPGVETQVTPDGVVAFGTGSTTADHTADGFTLVNSVGDTTGSILNSGMTFSPSMPAEWRYSDGSFAMSLRSNGIRFSPDSTLLILADGGTFVMSDSATASGAYLAPGSGTWDDMSDRNKKANFEDVDAAEVLEKVGSMPISTWNYKAQDESIRHIGPMAQDFRAAFGLGIDDKHIATIDADGVALAAIQGLLARVKALETENTRLQQELTQQDEAHSSELSEVKAQLAELSAAVQSLTAGSGGDKLAAKQ